MNIVLFGDSHLARFGKDRLVQLEELVNGSIVYNCSAGGMTSTDGAKRAELIGTLNPDVVVFSYGGNDVAPWKSVVPKELYLRNMRNIFQAFPNSKKVLFESPDVRLPDLDVANEYNNSIHDYRGELKPICDELGIAIVDGHATTASLGENNHEDDGIHMSDAAYSEVITALADTINSL